LLSFAELVLILLQAYDFDDDPVNPNYDRPDRGPLFATHPLQSQPLYQ
jgi:hypothetical protein